MAEGGSDASDRSLIRPSRRAFLKSGAVAGLSYLATGGLAFGRRPFGPPDAFAQGIAAGVPAAGGDTSVLLWTRATPPPGFPSTTVRWFLTADQFGEHVVARGEVEAVRDRNYVVKLTVADLEPGRSYWYRMEQVVQGKVRAGTEVGRAATLPSEAETSPALRLAVMSCQNYAHGYFGVHRYLARQRDIDLVVHLGDSIYADIADGMIANVIGGYARIDPTPPAATLDDYRMNYEQYLSDPSWRALRAAHPHVVISDDHEFFDGFAGGEQRQDPRVLAARRAFAEYMPIEVPDDLTQGLERIIPWGSDLRLVLQDARWYATPGDRWGDRQRARLGSWDGRRTIVLSPVRVDGARDVLVGRDKRTVIFSGDTHVQGAQEVHDGRRRIAVQYMTGAATSRSASSGYENWPFASYNTPGALVADVSVEGEQVQFLEADVSRPDGRVAVHRVVERDAYGPLEVGGPTDHGSLVAQERGLGG